MYKPKESIRWRPRVALPIRLDDQCLNAVVDMLSRAATKMTMTRNSREKKAIREYLTKTLPKSLHEDLLLRSVEKLVGVQTTLNLLDLFEPDQVAREKVDLLGEFRMGFGCYLKDGRLTWSQGSAKKFNLSVAQLDQLYNILIWANPSGLKELSASVSRDSLKLSRIPNILAKGRSLTKVTLLSGAENHTLRILGTSCPSLVYLDVSHSVRITDQGLRSLLLKRPPRRRLNLRQSGGPGSMSEAEGSQPHFGDPFSLEKNHCAETLLSITLLGTSVTWDGCDYACKLMNCAYLYSSLPLIKIVTVKMPEGKLEKGLFINRRALSIETPSELDDDMRIAVASYVDSCLGPDDLEEPVVDLYMTSKEGETNKSSLFVRRRGSFKLFLHMKLDATMVTSLVMPWYTFTWKMDSLVSLDTLGLSFPNLKFLRGRVRGVWNLDEPFLPNLVVACIWSLNSTTGLSILQNAPAIKFFEFNNTQTLGINDHSMELTDITVEKCVNNNRKLAESLEEIIIRPSRLTVNALHAFIRACPNLKRIGDLESWKMTTEEIAECNKYLDSMRSQCVLSIMNFPPTRSEKVEWI